MGLRRMGSAQRTRARAKARKKNGARKARERASRDRLMVTLIHGKSLPYIPAIMSWLSDKLEKPSKLITAEDVQSVVSEHTAAA